MQIIFRLAVALLFTLALGGAAWASEQSALLTARAQVAYHRGDYDAARDLFEQAIADDPEDSEAHYGLGLVLSRLGRPADAREAFEKALRENPENVRARGALGLPPLEALPLVRQPGDKRWLLYAATGVGYDSNVRLDPNDPVDDAVFTFLVSGLYDVLRSPRYLLRLEYDFYQTVHPDVGDFDFGSQRVRATGSYSVAPDVWLGLQSGYDYYSLGGDSYLQEPWVRPFLTVLEGALGFTRLTYRFGWDDYLGIDFDPIRDGPTNSVGIVQRFYLFGNPAQYVSLGYQYERDDPTRSSGDDYRRNGNTVVAGLAFTTWWKLFVQLSYAYRYWAYTEPNSVVDFRTRRYDNLHRFGVFLRRPIIPHVSAVLRYDGELNNSNIGLFQSRRNVVSALVEVTY